MEDGNACGLTDSEEAHHLHLHQRHFVQAQHCPGSIALHVCLQCLKMHRLQVADQPERRVVLVSLPCNLACPLVSFLASALSTPGDKKSQSKNYTTHKLLTYLRFDEKEGADHSAIAE